MTTAQPSDPPVRQRGRLPVPARVLMLATGDPSHDPRISWAAQTSAAIANTQVLGAVWHPEAEYRTFEDSVYFERFSVTHNASRGALELYNSLGRLNISPHVLELLAREGQPPSIPVASSAAWRITTMLRTQASHNRATVDRFVAGWGYYGAIASAMYRRIRTLPVAPAVIVALDLYALLAAVRVRRRLGCRIVYDSHELWPYADLLAAPWETRVVAAVERTLVRHADSVITVSPMIARLLEEMYGISEVMTVPNAAPTEHDVETSIEHSMSRPMKFLLQGGVAPGRGIDVLLEAWKSVDPARATLFLRCPETAYYAAIRERFRSLIEAGRVVVLDPVSPDQLVRAATFADVGVIPYVGPNPNHLYCCPNKLSQYMQAGLAVLTNDLAFVRSVVERYDIGATYIAESSATLVGAIHGLAGDFDNVAEMKKRARAAAVSEYNWSQVSRPYAEAIRRAIPDAHDRR